MTESQHATPTLVLGVGKTGYSVVKYLRGCGQSVVAADSRDITPYLEKLRAEHPEVALIRGRLPLDSLHRYPRVVLSPGIPLDSLAPLPAGCTPISDIELFAQNAAAPIIAITGSNGKSTVTSLVGEIITAAGKRALVGGNLGTPALDLLAQPRPDFYVLELSSFQLESTHTLRAHASAILNLSADHLDRYPDFAAYVAAKARITDGAALCVLGRDDPHSAQLRSRHKNAITFGLDPPPGPNHFGLRDTPQGKVLCHGEIPLGTAADSTLHGAHNIANLLAAFALTHAAGLRLSRAMLDAGFAWRGLAHRCELVGEVRGVKWFNDSKATNVGATVAACNGFAEKLILIAGGRGKGADFTPLQQVVAARVRQVVLFGEDAADLESALRDHAEISRVADLQAAVRVAADNARAGEVVLFSPACASFDMFADYAERGRVFTELVRSLGVAAEKAR